MQNTNSVYKQYHCLIEISGQTSSVVFVTETPPTSYETRFVKAPNWALLIVLIAVTASFGLKVSAGPCNADHSRWIPKYSSFSSETPILLRN